MAKVSTDRARAGQVQFPLPVHDKTATAKVNGATATIASQNEQSVTLAAAVNQDDLVEITFNPVDQYGQGRTEVFAPATGGTVSPTAQCGLAQINPAADLAALTINFPPNPGTNVVGRTQLFRVSPTKSVTTVTWGGGTVSGAPASLTAGKEVSFTFSADTGKWYLQP